MNFPMRVDKEKRYLPEKAYPNEIAYFFGSWVCKDKNNKWFVFTEKPLLDEETGRWIPTDSTDVLEVPPDRIIDPNIKWNEGLWGKE